MTSSRRITAAGALLAALAVPAGAQQPSPQPQPRDSAAASDSITQAFLQRTVTLTGVVRDTLGRPLGGAEVRVGADSQVVAIVTRQNGTFLLYGLSPDTLPLVVRRIGYEPVEVTLDLADKVGMRVDLAIKLTPVAVMLGTVVVEGKRMNLELMKNGFYQRQKLGMGKLFDAEYLDRFGGTLPALLHGVAGVSVSQDRNRRAIAFGKFGAHPCRLNVFLDGTFIPWASEVGLEQIAGARDLLAVEIYPRPLDVPANFVGVRTTTPVAAAGPAAASVNPRAAGASPDCGALLVWTKPFDESRR